MQKKNIKEEASSIEKMFKTKKGFTTTRSNIVKLSSKGEPLTYYVLDNLIAKSQSFGENCIVREDGTLFAFGTIFNRCPFLLQEKSTLFKHGGGCYEMIYFVKLKKWFDYWIKNAKFSPSKTPLKNFQFSKINFVRNFCLAPPWHANWFCVCTINFLFNQK